MKIIEVLVYTAILAIFPSCKRGMRAEEDPATGQIIIPEGPKPVLQYNYKTVLGKHALARMHANKYRSDLNGSFIANTCIYIVPRSNIIHSLYILSVELLTRDWSKDHPNHPGIYRLWPEVEYGKKLEDLCVLKIVFARTTVNFRIVNESDYVCVEADNT